MFSSIEFVAKGESYVSEKSIFCLSADKKKVVNACVDGVIMLSTDNGESFTEILMTGKEAGQLVHRAAIANVNSCVVSLDNGSVIHCSYDTENVSPNGFKADSHPVTKCPGKLTALAISPNGKVIICCGQNNEIKMIEVKQPGEYPIVAKLPVSHFIEAVQFNPEGTQFATVDCNGNASVYSISGESLRPADPILLKSEPSAKRQGFFQLSWSSSYLSVLCGSERVNIYKRADWSPIYLNHFGEDVYSYALVSDKLAYVMSPSGITATTPLSERSICKLLASSVCDQISVSDAKISAFEVDRCEVCAISESKLLLLNQKNCTIYPVNASISADDLITEKPKPTSIQKKGKFEKLESLSKKRRQELIEEEAEADEDEEEEDGEELEDEEDSQEEISGDEREASDVESDQSIEEKPIGKSSFLPAVKPVVQLGSTNWRNMQRFMAYNGVGYVTVRRDSDNYDMFNYDIELMDRGTHRPIRFSEAIEYELAALSEAGVLFANRNSIHFIPLADRKQTWTLEMKHNSVPVLVAVGLEYCYVVLKRGVVNMYTISGVFLRSFVCPAEPLSIVANADEVSFFSQDVDGVTCYSLNPQTGAQLSSSRVLIRDELIWCGFNSVGVLAAFTFNGRMLIRLTNNGHQWIEVLDVRSNLDIKRAWPCYFDVMSVSVINCSFEDAVPDPYPPKAMTELSFCIPEAPDSAIEEVVRTKLIVHETVVKSSDALTEKERKRLDMASDRHLLEMAQLAIRAGRIGRVVELARMVAGEKSMDLMIQLAKHHKLIAVVDDLERLRFPVNAAVVEPVQAAVIKTVEPVQVAVPSQESVPLQADVQSVQEVVAPLTPIKCAPSVESVLAASSVDPSPVPVNPFLKSANSKSSESQKPSAILDFVASLMKVPTKRKAEPNENESSANKRL